MKASGAPCTNRGFTMVELLVVVAILIILASLVFVGAQKAIESARIASNLSNMRNLAPTLTGFAQRNGGYPPGWSFTKGESWANVVLREQNGEGTGQDPNLLSPLVARNIPRELRGPTISNYSVNPIIFPQESGPGQPYKVNPMQLQRPSEQMLLGDGLPRAKDAPYGFAMIVYWAFRGGATGNSGTPPESDIRVQDRVVNLPKNIAEMTHDGSQGLPAFRNRGKCHFLFADGHVEALLPEDLKYKHFAISY